VSPCGINILLCMFNGFAFARPLCGPIKVNLTGVGFRVSGPGVRWGSRAAGGYTLEFGDGAADGVDQPIYFPHDV